MKKGLIATIYLILFIASFAVISAADAQCKCICYVSDGGVPSEATDQASDAACDTACKAANSGRSARGECMAQILGEPVNNQTLGGFIKLAEVISKWILGITGSLALLAFIYGGFVWMLSGGSSERVNKGKQIFLGAVVGLVIVFASYMIIGFVLTTSGLATSDSWSTSAFTTSWFSGK